MISPKRTLIFFLPTTKRFCTTVVGGKGSWVGFETLETFWNVGEIGINPPHQPGGGKTAMIVYQNKGRFAGREKRQIRKHPMKNKRGPQNRELEGLAGGGGREDSVDG